MTTTLPQPSEDFEPAEAAGECFSMRQRLIDLGVDPRSHLKLAHTMLTSGLRLDIKRYNPGFPTSGISMG